MTLEVRMTTNYSERVTSNNQKEQAKKTKNNKPIRFTYYKKLQELQYLQNLLKKNPKVANRKEIEKRINILKREIEQENE